MTFNQEEQNQQLKERAEKAEAEVARLTAILNRIPPRCNHVHVTKGQCILTAHHVQYGVFKHIYGYSLEKANAI